MNRIVEQVSTLGGVPVITNEKVENVFPLVQALYEEGLDIVEVIFKTEDGKETIATISRELPDVMVGAGSVLTVQQVDDAIEAGAKFVVSPRLNPAIVKYCKQRRVMVIPSCSDSSDIECAMKLGLDMVKSFSVQATEETKLVEAGSILESNSGYLSFEKVMFFRDLQN